MQSAIPNSSSSPIETPLLGQRAATLATRITLGAIIALAAFLHLFRLDQEGFANLYYAATVKSMLTNWHNFFFASFDPGGFVTVDKPPLGFWVQTISAMIFGFSGWSVLLPQAIAGILSVALLYHLVARTFGAPAGLIAALTLTVTPISIAANRNNTIDSQLVFVLLLATWTTLLAIERGQLRWLLASAILVGIGFNIKMLQAMMVLPAFWFAYLIAAKTQWRWRFAHLTIASFALAVVSLAWVAMVDFTPSENRPYVGSSQNNTEMELIVGHNGLTRLGTMASWIGFNNPLQREARPAQLAQPRPGQAPINPPQPGQLEPRPAQPRQPAQPGQLEPRPGQPGQTLPQPGQPDQPIQPGQPQAQPGQPGQPRLNDETGTPSILRLFNAQLAGQISWLLPLALISMILVALELRNTQYATRSFFAALVLWSAWLIPQIIFFSFAGLFHRYYLEMLAPAIAALVGAGVVAMWRMYQQHVWRGLILPIAFAFTALVEMLIVINAPPMMPWLAPFVIIAALGCALALIVFRIVPAPRALRAGAMILGLLVLLIAPTIWACTPLASADSGLPFAGPELLNRPARGTPPNDNRLVEFLRANRSGTEFLVATINANSAASIILATGEPVMAVGGFSGNDPILTTSEFAELVANNTVRYFFLPQNSPQNEIARWVTSQCSPVGQAQRQAQPGAMPLFDCAKGK